MRSTPDRPADLVRDGFRRFDDFLTADQVSAAVDRVDQLRGDATFVDDLHADAAFEPLWRRPELIAAARRNLRSAVLVTGMRCRVVPGHHEPGQDELEWGALLAELRDPGFDSCHAILTLTRSTARNGAPRVIPGSHVDGFETLLYVLDGILEARGRRSRRARNTVPGHPKQVLLTGRAGTCWLIGSGLWAAETRNDSDNPTYTVYTTFIGGAVRAWA